VWRVRLGNRPITYSLAPYTPDGASLFLALALCERFHNMGVKDEQIRNQKSSREARVGKTPRFNEAQFVRYELDKEQQSACKASAITEAELFDELLALVGDGYKFTVKWDDYSQCHASFMQLSHPVGPNANLILTGRGSTPFKALKQLLWKHSVCLDGDWSGYAERRGGDTIDD